MSNLELTFFGLTLSHRTHMFNQIHEILFYGQGGYNYDVVYNMPIWLRKFTFHKLQEHYEKKNSQSQEDAYQTSIKNLKSVSSDKTINPPSYITKASKK